MPHPHITVSAIVMLRLSEVTEMESPGLCDCKTQAFCHARLSWVQWPGGDPAPDWICSWTMLMVSAAMSLK